MSEMVRNAHQKVHEIDNYSPCTHKSAITGSLQRNIHTTLLDLDVLLQISCRFHSQILDFLA